MRSSKSRSRSKQNRNRPSGNIINRVFDSSGPEGKVRGTPQQIIDKYNQLARDAQLSGDRVATENFQQHAEHYTRMLAEAQREIEARREQQEAQHRERQQQQAEARAERQERAAAPADPAVAPQPDVDMAPIGADVIEMDGGADSGLVETPESKPEPKSERKPRTRRPRRAEPKPADAPPAETASGSDGPGPAEAAE